MVNSRAVNNISILLGCYRPNTYLIDQLESINDQTHPHWSIFLSDDSPDQSWQSEYSKHLSELEVKISQGPQLGFVNNFMKLVRNENIQSEFYAFCDQDDLWLKDKLESILTILMHHDQTIPIIYCGRTCVVDEGNGFLGYSPLFNRKPSFKNALIQNIGGGNTMVFNHSARELLLACPFDLDVVSHDWFFYQLVTGAGGLVIYDSEPYVRYRQHDNNLVGANIGWSARFSRVKLLLAGRFRDWNEINTKALLGVADLLTSESKKTLELFMRARAGRNFLVRLYWLKRSGLYRQTFLGNLGLIIGLLLRKV